MSNGGDTKWRFLIVEDKPDIARQLEEACPRFVAPEPAEAEVCSNFKEAVPLLDSRRYDVLIIDLKDDSSNLSEEENLPGLKIYEEVKKRRFVPVVFYTALPKHVLPEQTAFVRVVEKGPGFGNLMAEVRSVFNTHLPALSRHLDQEQRKYLWDFVSKHWKEMVEFHDKVDLVYLVARRLSQTLRSDSIRRFVEQLSRGTTTKSNVSNAPEALSAAVTTDSSENAVPESSDVVHPIELYIYPCTNQQWLAGDIFTEEVGGKKEYWVVLTPSCDFENDKAQHVVLAKCDHLTEQEEFLKWSANAKEPSKKALKGMEEVISDNRGGQKERFKFLPATFFLPDLVIDFQQLRSVRFETLDRTKVVASLDSPYAEATLARFSRYFGRLGTPDIDKNVVLARLQESLKRSSVTPKAPSAL
ncbi:MAG: hypothetical protein HY360_26380 [Verrucomicrobia bacterium]|nr:hypothetical protein [Verrucomicrobiota bacterium]